MRPVSFEVTAERISQYADAVGGGSPIHRDADAAREAGYRDVVAPPMFAVVYSAPAMGPPIFEVIGEALPRMVHGGQEFVWGEPVAIGYSAGEADRRDQRAQSPSAANETVRRNR